MKCQHCGINYEDSERECPICGARAGTRGRVGELEKKAAAWRERQMEDDPNYRKVRPRVRKARPSARPIRDKRPGQNKGKAAVIAVAVVVLLNILPALASVAGNFFENLGDSFSALQADLGWGESQVEPAWDDYEDDTIYYTPGGTYEYDENNYTSVYVRLYDLIGDNAMATLSDGTTFHLWVDNSEWDGYALTLDDGTGTYEEKGYFWGLYNYPEEQMYDDNYPPEQYDSLTLCLTLEGENYSGTLHERYDSRIESTDLWLIAYVDHDTGLITLQDIDETGIFGGDMFVALNNLEQG